MSELITRRGGHTNVVRFLASRGLSYTPESVCRWGLMGIRKLSPNTRQAIEYLQEPIEPATRDELIKLIRHFGGAAGTHSFLKQHHPGLKAAKGTLLGWLHSEDSALSPLAVRVCFALREQAPRFKSQEGRYRPPKVSRKHGLIL